MKTREDDIELSAKSPVLGYRIKTNVSYTVSWVAETSKSEDDHIFLNRNVTQRKTAAWTYEIWTTKRSLTFLWNNQALI